MNATKCFKAQYFFTFFLELTLCGNQVVVINVVVVVAWLNEKKNWVLCTYVYIYLFINKSNGKQTLYVPTNYQPMKPHGSLL